MFKRNQVEEAIAIVLEPGPERLSSEMRTRLRRLLETDRSLGRSKRSADPERANFAFHSGDVPGRGLENWFTGYEAFALLTGLRLMRDGWPQGHVVATLRRVRPDLERHHARILADPTVLFHKAHVRQHSKPGALAVSNADPLFLAIHSKDQEGRLAPNTAAICRGHAELMQCIKRWGPWAPGQTWTVMEFGAPIQALSSALAKAVPRKRSRGANSKTT